MITHVDGRRVATPLLIVLIAIGSSDLLFALDSIPAVFGVTEEAFIVFAANAFALLGLRALYFLVTGLLDRLVYLSTGLSLILAFIGVKLLLHYGHLQDNSIPEVETSTSLLVILIVLAITVVASLLKARRDPDARAHAACYAAPATTPANVSRDRSRLARRHAGAEEGVLVLAGEDVDAEAGGDLVADAHAPDAVAVDVQAGRETPMPILPGTTARIPPLTPLLAGTPTS